MTTTVADVRAAAERLWPAAGAEPWDSVGLICGEPHATVSSVLLAVDAVIDTVDEALERGADLLLVHHPLLLRGVTSVAADRYKGAVLTRLIRGECALFAAHTNADVVATGTSAVLADRLGLRDVRPLDARDDGVTGIGRVGVLPEPMSLGRLAGTLVDLLPPTASGVRGSGEYDRAIRRVALCAGAGDSFLEHPEVAAADVYITADLRHHPASEARENARISRGPALLDVSHWASEWLWLAHAAAELAAELPDITIEVSDLRTDPWDFAVTGLARQPEPAP